MKINYQKNKQNPNALTITNGKALKLDTSFFTKNKTMYIKNKIKEGKRREKNL